MWPATVRVDDPPAGGKVRVSQRSASTTASASLNLMTSPLSHAKYTKSTLKVHQKYTESTSKAPQMYLKSTPKIAAFLQKILLNS